MGFPRIRTVVAAVIVSSLLSAGVAVAGQSQLPAASQCDVVQPGVCETVTVPEFCLPDLGCFPPIEIEIPGVRT